MLADSNSEQLTKDFLAASFLAGTAAGGIVLTSP